MLEKADMSNLERLEVAQFTVYTSSDCSKVFVVERVTSIIQNSSVMETGKYLLKDFSPFSTNVFTSISIFSEIWSSFCRFESGATPMNNRFPASMYTKRMSRLGETNLFLVLQFRLRIIAKVKTVS